MSDILTIPAPDYCTAQRFNLWLSMTIGVRSPLIGMALVEACKGAPVNPFTLGCVAVTLSSEFADREAVAHFDLFATGAVYSSFDEACAFAVKKAMMAGSLDRLLPAAEHGPTVRGHYAAYVRFAKRMSGEKDAPPAPTPPPPAPPAPPAPKPAPVPAPAPAPAPAPTKPGKWKGTVKVAIGVITALLGVGAWLIPDHFKAPLRALLALLKALVEG